MIHQRLQQIQEFIDLGLITAAQGRILLFYWDVSVNLGFNIVYRDKK